MFLIFVEFGVFLVIIVGHLDGEGALHESFVLGGDLSGRSAVDDVGVIAAADQERAEGDGEVKTVACLPLEDVCRRGDVLWQLHRIRKLLVFKEVRDKLRTLVPVIELSVRKLSWSDSCAYELANAALVLRSEKELAVRVIYDLELTLVLQYVLENQLLL